MNFAGPVTRGLGSLRCSPIFLPDLPSLRGLSGSRFSPDTSLFCRYCKWHPIPIFTFELFPASVWAAIDFVSVGVLAFCPAALLELFTRGSGLFLWLRVSQCPLGFVICKTTSFASQGLLPPPFPVVPAESAPSDRYGGEQLLPHLSPLDPLLGHCAQLSGLTGHYFSLQEAGSVYYPHTHTFLGEPASVGGGRQRSEWPQVLAQCP